MSALANIARLLEDPQVARRLQRKVRARVMRESLPEFVRGGWHVLEPGTPLEWNWHLEAICLHLQAVLEDWMRHQEDQSFVQRCQNLLINVPPGTGKSRLTSVYMPAWMWLRWPAWRAIFLSANPRVALRDSMLCRNVINSKWYQELFEPTWTMSEDQDAKGLFANTAGGWRYAGGWNAKIIGERGDAIVVDDPHDADEVKSDTLREGVLERWDTAIANRVNDLRSSVRIGIMQRLHRRDWSGHVSAQGGWESLILPMRFEPSRYEEDSRDPIPRVTFAGWSDPRTEEGEVLHEERFPPDVLAKEEARLGEAAPGQLQQRPGKKGGNMFKRDAWRFWKHDGVGTDAPRPRDCYEGPAVPLPERFELEIISVDATFVKSPESDLVCMGHIGILGARRFLLDLRWARMSFTESVDTLRAFRKGAKRVRKVLVEKKANGDAILDSLSAEIEGMFSVEPKGGKEARAAAIQPQQAAGNLYLPDGAPWLGRFIDEFADFPRGDHDDAVDMLSQALISLMEDAAELLEVRGLYSW